MKLPEWAPPELVEIYNRLRPKAEAAVKRARKLTDAKHPVLDWKYYIESGAPLNMGNPSLSDSSLFRLLEPLITNPSMQSVWKNLQRRKGDFQHVQLGMYGGSSQCVNLAGACFQAEHRWINLPKWTRAEFKKVHEDIAARALQLCELLVHMDHSRSMLDLGKYIEEEKLREFLTALEEDGLEDWPGLDGYLEHLIGEMLPSVPKLLLELHKRALEQAKRPYVVSQPNSRSARLNFFIQQLSSYFHKAYGQPLNAYVAGIVSAIFDEDVDEDRVRALLRARRQASQTRSRKKVEERGENSSG